jgi:hypothetical protein
MINESCISIADWKLLWATIGATDLSRVEFRNYTGFESPDEIKQATRIVADVMRINRRIVHLEIDPESRDQELWKTSIEPYVQQNLLASNLDNLSTQPDEDLRAAIVGHLLQSNRDNNAAFFQILTQNMDVIVANAPRGSELHLNTAVQHEAEQPNRRGRKRRDRD